VPEYLAPGVYAEEKEISAKPIEGVRTSTAGFLGDAERGTIKKYSLERNITKLSFAISLLDDYSKGKPIGRVDVSLKDRKEKPVKNLSSYYLFLDLSDGTYTVQVKSDYYFDEEGDISLPRPKDFAFRSGSGGAEHDSTEAILEDISGLRDRDVLEFDNESDPPERRMIFLDSDPTTNKIHWEGDPRGGLEYDYGEDAKIRLPVPENLVIRMLLKPKPSYPFPPGATLIRGKVYDSAGEAISGAKVRVRGKDVENKTTEEGEFVLYFGPLTEEEIIRVDGKRFVKGDDDKTLYLEAEGVTEPKELEAEEGKTTSVIIN
jgi:hypothetical protein